MMYRGVLIAERANGSFDIILPHRWLNRPTLRSAKWWVSVYHALQYNTMVSNYPLASCMDPSSINDSADLSFSQGSGVFQREPTGRAYATAAN